VIVDACQRWELGRASKRPAGETIRAREDGYEVAPVAGAAARAFVEQHHYSGSASPPAHPFALWRRGELVGVALFGPPASMNAHRAVFPGLAIGQAVTLGRLVLLDEVPGNGESWFVARCLRELTPRGVVGVESCADPVARRDARGARVFPGHAGTIYQALSGRYVGRTNASTKYLLPDGRELSNRAAGKLVRGEVGRAYAGSVLVEYGAAPLARGEDPLAWLRRWRPRICRAIRHRGCHRYLWCLDRRRRREVLARPALAYPKIDLERAEACG
jgi:hypothetical protein